MLFKAEAEKQSGKNQEEGQFLLGGLGHFYSIPKHIEPTQHKRSPELQFPTSLRMWPEPHLWQALGGGRVSPLPLLLAS